jgi:two-component system response regulator AtoC
MIRVLTVDDEEPFRRLLKKELSRKGFFAEVAPDAEEALRLLKGSSYDVILLDILMPGMDGIAMMKRLKADPAAPSIIVLTGKATVETAVEAMKHGAYDYLTKPYKLEELVILINRAYEYGKLEKKNRQFQQELIRKETPVEFVGKSAKIKSTIRLIEKIAPTDSTVFIQGESGTGKELAANTVWRRSKRSGSPFIALNCATLSENLIESELFGHEKGAFTSAYQAKYGIVEVADKGTLFLDEISELPLGLQAKLLRFLDSGEFRRVGGNKTLTVDVRVIAATNKDLTGLIKDGRFRQDLFYRLNVINIALPPLRERKEDIDELSRYFLEQFSRSLAKSISGFSVEALEALNGYAWPGNVRELENVIERAVILCDSETIGLADLSMPSARAAKEDGSHHSLEDMERDYILKVLDEAGGNQSKASQLLGIDRKTLYLKLKRYGINELQGK